MSMGLVGRKCGMTRIFEGNGVSVPVSVISVIPNRVTQVRTKEKDGYTAVQVVAGEVKASRVSKPMAGLFSKTSVSAGNRLKEFRVSDQDVGSYSAGSVIGVDIFSVGQKVDVAGVSKGKGFQGAIKRWNFATQDASHGNSLSHRAPGSIGQNQSPGRVFKGKKMAGHMGARNVSVQSLEVVRVDVENNLLLIKGAIPGATGSDVVVTSAVKVRS